MKASGLLRFALWGSALALFASLAGCGGSGALRTASVSGRVTDDQGLPVRGARVWTRDSETTTSTNGAYYITLVRQGDEAVNAEFFQGGTRYWGRNVARTSDGEQAISVNIMVAPASQMATLRGNVTDRFGRALSGASVFAYGAGAFSSARAITDSRGNYDLPGLIAGVTYTVNAGGGGYSSDTDSVALSAGEVGGLNFVLGSPGFPVLPAVSALQAIAWTSQGVSRSPGEAAAIEAVKREFDPARAAARSRATGTGAPIEVQLEWTPLSGDDVLGYGIFRGTAGGTISALDFWRDPLAGAYLDGDVNLRPGRTYTYEVSALGTRYPDDPDSEGPRTAVDARTLDDLSVNSVQYGPIRFSWRAVPDATAYVVYVYDRYPGIGVTSLWNNQSAPTGSNSLAYGGPALNSGQLYYYIVLGLGNQDGDGVWRSRTISQIGELRP